MTRELDWYDAGPASQSLHESAHLLVINDAVEQLAVTGIVGKFPLRFFQGVSVAHLITITSCQNILQGLLYAIYVATYFRFTAALPVTPCLTNEKFVDADDASRPLVNPEFVFNFCF